MNAAILRAATSETCAIYLDAIVREIDENQKDYPFAALTALRAYAACVGAHLGSWTASTLDDVSWASGLVSEALREGGDKSRESREKMLRAVKAMTDGLVAAGCEGREDEEDAWEDAWEDDDLGSTDYIEVLPDDGKRDEVPEKEEKAKAKPADFRMSATEARVLEYVALHPYTTVDEAMGGCRLKRPYALAVLNGLVKKGALTRSEPIVKGRKPKNVQYSRAGETA